MSEVTVVIPNHPLGSFIFLYSWKILWVCLITVSSGTCSTNNCSCDGAWTMWQRRQDEARVEFNALEIVKLNEARAFNPPLPRLFLNTVWTETQCWTDWCTDCQLIREGESVMPSAVAEQLFMSGCLVFLLLVTRRLCSVFLSPVVGLKFLPRSRCCFTRENVWPCQHCSGPEENMSALDSARRNVVSPFLLLTHLHYLHL